MTTIRNTFEKELQGVKDNILRVGSEIEENMLKTVDALMRRDLNLARQIIHADEWVNEQHISITMSALSLIATQQPTARDLRLLASAMGISNELERIHDYVAGIGKINLMIDEDEIPGNLINSFPEMARDASSMLHRALGAFSRHDADTARLVVKDDKKVDKLYNNTYKKIINYLVDSPTAVDEMHRLDWVNHNLERAADRVGNICEWVVYMAEGVYAELN
jgi:phosphate transport system protein